MKQYIKVEVGHSRLSAKQRLAEVHYGLRTVPCEQTIASVYVDGDRVAGYKDGASAVEGAQLLAGFWGYAWGKKVTAKAAGLVVYETIGAAVNDVVDEEDLQ